MAKFQKTFCSQCGGEFGPGESGYSHCQDHIRPVILAKVSTSHPWNWRTDYVDQLEKEGLVRIEHGRSKWSLTVAGCIELARLTDDRT